MADHEEGPLSRWSRLKREAEAAAKVDKVDVEGGAAVVEQHGEPRQLESGAESAGQQPIPIEDLPDIDTLTYNSDFTVFLQEGVPDALRRLALARLWRTDPILANLDGLNDYDEDYRIVASAEGSLSKLLQPESRAELAMDREARRSRHEADARDGVRTASPVEDRATDLDPDARDGVLPELGSNQTDNEA